MVEAAAVKDLEDASVYGSKSHFNLFVGHGYVPGHEQSGTTHCPRVNSALAESVNTVPTDTDTGCTLFKIINLHF